MSRPLNSGRQYSGKLIPMMVLATIAATRLPLDAQNTSVAGVVKSAAGEPVSGALVKVRSEELGLGFMVVSEAQGRYSTPNLLPGKYAVQAFGEAYQSASAGPLEIASRQQGKMDLMLNIPLEIPPRGKRLTDADYEQLMPEGGLAKGFVRGKCVDCHSLQWIVSARKSREKWVETVDRMYDDLLGYRQPLLSSLEGGEPSQGEAGTPDRVKALPREEREMLDYLAKYLGPDAPLDPRIAEQLLPYPGGPSHPHRNLPAKLLKGAAAQYVAMEFSLPAGSMPNGIAVDSQGIAWITERSTGMIGRFDPNSLAYTRIASPPAKNKPELESAAVDPENQIWFVDSGPNARILHYNPTTREFNGYAIPDYPFPVPDTGGSRIAALRFLNGNVWATRINAQRILKLDPSARRTTEYAVPKGATPFGLAIGRDNMVWYSAEIGNAVVKLDPGTGRMTPYNVPVPRSDLRGMASDAEGNLWVAANESGKLVKLDSHTGQIVEYAPPTEESGPFAVDVDQKRNLIWFSEIFSDKIARFDPGSNTFVEFPQPAADLDVRQIHVDPSRPNRIWWSGTSADKIGYIEVIE